MARCSCTLEKHEPGTAHVCGEIGCQGSWIDHADDPEKMWVVRFPVGSALQFGVEQPTEPFEAKRPPIV